MRETPESTRTEVDEGPGLAAVPRRELELLAASMRSPRRRAVLATLRTAGGLPLTELATRVAARERGVEPAEVSDDRHESVLISLHHTHVPKLAEAGAVDRAGRSESAVVRPTTSVSDGDWTEAVEAAVREEGAGEAVTALLADPRRAHVAELLGEADGPLALDDVATAVAEAEHEGPPGPSERAVTSTAVSLHHSHLPKLADVGVVEYDADERTVSPGTLPDARLAALDVAAADRHEVAASALRDGAD
ncbi:DUF7344 domain-containing protein [Halorarum salinum]|uniref:DUF7344 domain-containing protein n=1 Tax=Halorarum salinum TaxID=2743089 RepID=A0A7D5L920_9EURY|nr:hypothetical protein [Halobaculum salinum]QLG60954.1 hypothetical protein HUG12_04065 [Halobaculum salinum]